MRSISHDNDDDRNAAEILLDCHIEEFKLQGDTGWYSYMFGSEPRNLPNGKLLIAAIHGQHSDGEIATIYECFCNGMLRHLEAFSIFGGSLSDEGMQWLSKLTSLRELEVEHCDLITDYGIQQLTLLSNLRRLSLVGASISDLSVPVIFSLPSLTELDLAWTKVSDLGLVKLARNMQIEKLVLDGISLTDHGLAGLGCLKSLRTLEVHHTHVSGDGIAQLKSKLPDCNISWGPY